MFTSCVPEVILTLPYSRAYRTFVSFVSRDKVGTFFDDKESISLIADRSPVPIFGVWDFNLGYGMVGGMLTSGFAQGEAAAMFARRILNGENVDSIPVMMKSPNRFMFDYNMMTGFNISISNLPNGSIVVNKPDGFYEFYSRNRFYVLGIIMSKNRDSSPNK